MPDPAEPNALTPAHDMEVLMLKIEVLVGIEILSAIDDLANDNIAEHWPQRVKAHLALLIDTRVDSFIHSYNRWRAARTLSGHYNQEMPVVG